MLQMVIRGSNISMLSVGRGSLTAPISVTMVTMVKESIVFAMRKFQLQVGGKLDGSGAGQMDSICLEETMVSATVLQVERRVFYQ